MQIFAVLCLAAVALARPNDYSSKGVVTTVTERTFTIRGDASPADKYYGSSGSAGSSLGYSAGSSGSSGSSGLGYSAGASGYAGGVSSYAASQPSYSFKTVASAVPVAARQQQSYQQSYQYQQAAPAVAYQAAYQQAAPAVAYQAAPAVAYQAAPAVAYQATYQAAPVAYQAAYAAPVSYTAVTAAPAVAYQTATAAPAVAYQAAYQQAAPAVSYTAAAPAVYQQAQTVGVRAESSFDNSNNYEQGNFETNYQDSQVSGADTKVFKHVYAFAAPEEPATRATVRVQAPVSKRKHYKLVFIKAPQQQTVVDSDITLPAQEEEKTLIYVLSKNQKQQQPEIRIKQAAASKHAKPEVFFLKYKNEAEAQAIASGAISGQSANIPAQGEIISDGSVSILGQSSGSEYNAGSNFGSNFGSSASSASFDNSFRSGAKQLAVAAPVEYRSSFGANNAGVSAVSTGSLGISSPVIATIGSAPATSGFSFGAGLSDSSAYNGGASAYNGGASAYNGGASAGLSRGFSAYNSGSSSYSASAQEPASVAISVTSEPAEALEGATASSLSL